MTSDRSWATESGQASPEEVLVALRRELLVELEAARAALDDLRLQRADRVDDDEHDPEGMPLSAVWLRLNSLRRATEARIVEVDSALASAKAGKYGMCLSCGRQIPPGRLEARPTASMCVECAAR